MQNLCMNCGSVAHSKTKNKGSIGIEAGLLLISVLGAILNVFFGAALFLIFVIYCLWRLTTKHQACPVCESVNIVPAHSPVAQNIIAQMSGTNR